MGNDKHWSTGLTKREIADQVLAMWLHDNDHVRVHDDDDLLEALLTFSDSLDEKRDMYYIEHLAHYVIPFTHITDYTIALAGDHIEYVTGLIQGWIDSLGDESCPPFNNDRYWE